ncbi:MAG: GTPase ObgE [Rhodobacteraceae bacterium]|nr:GTPase ObgE [Paracoccaceae bacterium]
MQFIDLARITVRSGSGGNGSTSFRREKHVEFGGPDGGDGGRGGSVYAEADANLNTLVDFRYRRHAFACNGGHGRGKKRTGANGANVIVKVPCGTEVLSDNCETLLFDLTAPGQRVMLARGGNGGFGNVRFKSSTNRAPREANDGQPGIERTYWLRLKVLADVGLIGVPNVGKSTFLAAASNARPRIGDYPFTTLHPNLGSVVLHGDEFVLADLPGLVEDSHLGRGLGDRFLGHVERCKVLLHIVDSTSDDPVREFSIVNDSIRLYGNGLAEKPRLVALNKSDAVVPEVFGERIEALRHASNCSVVGMSAATRDGMDACLRALLELVRESREKLTANGSEAFGDWTP